MEPTLHNQSIDLKSTFTKTLLQNELKKEAQVMHTLENGIQENGIQKKVTLKEAADIVQVPKKTLEDYIQIFNKAKFITNIEEISERKMGYLRSIMKKNKSKIRKAMILQKQKTLEEKLQKQNQEEVYENTQQNKIEDEQLTFTYPNFQNNLSENFDQEKQGFYEDDDWEYSNQFFNKICLNHHFD